MKQYIKYFLNNELVIISENTKSFPKIAHEFERPFLIDLLTIEMDNICYDIDYFFEQKIDEFGITCLRLFSNNFNSTFFFNLLNKLINSKVKTVNLIQ